MPVTKLSKHEIEQHINLIQNLGPSFFRRKSPCDYCKPVRHVDLHGEWYTDTPFKNYCWCDERSKSLEEHRNKLLELHSQKHYYLFKVTKSHNMAEAEFVRKALALPTKFKGWFINYHFSIEFNVESGIVPHAHIVLADVDKRKDKLNKKKDQLVKYFDTPDNMVYKEEIDFQHFRNKVNYIKGLKTEDKQHLIDLDNKSREKYNLDVYYNG